LYDCISVTAAILAAVIESVFQRAHKMSSADSSLLGWITAGVVSVIAALAGAVATLFKLRENENARAISELKEQVSIAKEATDKCEKDRVELFADCKLMKYEIEVLKEKINLIDKDGTQFSRSRDNQKGHA
jgi:anti-sigma-K factor RskA